MLAPTASADVGQVIDGEAPVSAGHPAAEHMNATAQVAGENASMKSIYGVTVPEAGSDLEVEVNYETRPFPGPDCTKTADLDMYLYGPDGNELDSHTGCDSGTLGVGETDLSPGQYEVVVVGTHGVSLDYSAEGTLIY